VSFGKGPIDPSISGRTQLPRLLSIPQDSLRTRAPGFLIGNKTAEDFRLLSDSGSFDRGDDISDEENHSGILNAMITIGFSPETIRCSMRIVYAILFAGSMTFTPSQDEDSGKRDITKCALACAALLGITFDGFSLALTSRSIIAAGDTVHTPLTIEESGKACEALIKAVYGSAFDFIVERVNSRIPCQNENFQA
jgi:myosin heavy subunit